MSPYSTKLAEARLDALRTLVDALNEAETPHEKRRCAVAIFNAPDPCDLDDSIEFDDDEDDEVDEVVKDDAAEQKSSDPDADPRQHQEAQEDDAPTASPAVDHADSIRSAHHSESRAPPRSVHPSDISGVPP